jgi:hypothetical protein
LIATYHGHGGLLFGVPGLGLPRGGGQGLQLSLVFDGLHVFPFPAATAPTPEMMNTNNSAPIWIVFRNFMVMTSFSLAKAQPYLLRSS